VAVFATDFELAARERPVFIVFTAPGLLVVPEARRTDQGTSVRATSPVVHDDLEQEVASLSFEAFPSLLAELFEYAVKRRMRDHQATDAAAVARVDNRESAGMVAHDSSPAMPAISASSSHPA
jgi:hypothetical protein